jgi:pyridoxine 5-phosphate synthase
MYRVRSAGSTSKRYNSLMKLGVNIDHVATLRQVRGASEPAPVLAGGICQAAGADSIVIHLREDRRHIQDQDLFLLKKIIKIKLNLEMSIAKEIVDIACLTRPDQVTLVPEKRQEVTTEGGLDVVSQLHRVKQACDRLKKAGIAVSLFIDPERKQIVAAKKIGVKIIELHTGRYADAKTAKAQNKYYKELAAATHFAKAKGMTVNAGHGLNYNNVSRIAKIKGIEELNIGYAIVCRAVIVGLERAVKEMQALIK